MDLSTDLNFGGGQVLYDPSKGPVFNLLPHMRAEKIFPDPLYVQPLMRGRVGLAGADAARSA